MKYLMKGADEDDFETIYAVLPALAGTLIGYAEKDGTAHYDVVVGWAVVSNGTPEPMTMSGVWSGCDQANSYVKFPDGRCGRFEATWADEAACIADLGPRAPS